MSLNPVKVVKPPERYFEALTGEVRKRYLKKIKIIKNCNPFMLKANELSSNLKELLKYQQ